LNDSPSRSAFNYAATTLAAVDLVAPPLAMNAWRCGDAPHHIPRRRAAIAPHATELPPATPVAKYAPILCTCNTRVRLMWVNRRSFWFIAVVFDHPHNAGYFAMVR